MRLAKFGKPVYYSYNLSAPDEVADAKAGQVRKLFRTCPRRTSDGRFQLGLASAIGCPQREGKVRYQYEPVVAALAAVQRPADRLDLRAGGPWLQHGLRYYPASELRTRRYHHGRRLRRLLRYDDVPHAPHRIRCHRRHYQHAAWCRDRKGRLYAAAQSAASEPADHRHRYLLPAGKRRAAALRLRYEEHGPHCPGQYLARLGHHQQRRTADYPCDNRFHGGPDAHRPEDQARQGHARGL